MFSGYNVCNWLCFVGLLELDVILCHPWMSYNKSCFQVPWFVLTKQWPAIGIGWRMEMCKLYDVVNSIWILSYGFGRIFGWCKPFFDFQLWSSYELRVFSRTGMCRVKKSSVDVIIHGGLGDTLVHCMACSFHCMNDPYCVCLPFCSSTGGMYIIESDDLHHGLTLDSGDDGSQFISPHSRLQVLI